MLRLPQNGPLPSTPNRFSGRFVLVKPNEPNEELGDYRCNKRVISWFFCKVCGVRCFAFGGEGEVVDLDLDKWLGKTDTEGTTTKI